MITRWLRFVLSLLLAAALLLQPGQSMPTATAATNVLIWTGVTDTDWSTPSNWNVQGVRDHRAPQNGDTLIFPSGSAKNSTDDIAGLSITDLLIEEIGTNLQGSQILTVTGHIGASTRAFIDLPLALIDQIEIKTPNNAQLTIQQAISGDAGGILKTGTGYVALYGEGTFERGITIEGGEVYLAHAKAAGRGPIQVNSGGRLLPYMPGFVLNNALTLSGSGPDQSGALSYYFENSQLNINGPLTLNGAVTMRAINATIFINSAITSAKDTSGDLTMIGGGAVHLAGNTANTFTGRLLIPEGTLVLEKPAGVVAVPGDLRIGSSATQAEAIVDVWSDGQISPASQVMLYGNTTLALHGTSQTVGGLYGNSPCTLALDMDTQHGSLTFQTVSGPQNYIACNVNGTGSLIITGNGMQGFYPNPAPFAGSIEVKAGAAGYVYGFHSTGSYTARQGSYGGLGESTEIKTVLIESSPYFMFEPSENSVEPPRLGSLTMTGSTQVYFELYSTTSPVVVVDTDVDLGGANLQACFISANYLPGVTQQRTLIKNNSGQAVAGTFKGVPEGGLARLQDCWNSSTVYPVLISYHGGSSHQDVTLTRATQLFLPMVTN